MSIDEGGEIDADVTVDEAAAKTWSDWKALARTLAAHKAQKEVFDEIFSFAPVPIVRWGASVEPTPAPAPAPTAATRQAQKEVLDTLFAFAPVPTCAGRER